MKKIFNIVLVILLLLIGSSATAAPKKIIPSDLTAAAVSVSQINLNWQDNWSKESGYIIERSLDSINFSQIALLSANTTAFSDNGLSPEITYHYRVKGFKNGKRNRVTYTAYSNIASSTTLGQVPDAPSNLISNPYSSTSTAFVILNWSDNSNNEYGFKVERSDDRIDFNLVSYVIANLGNYADYDVLTGETYYYRVASYNNYGDSDYSNISQATIP